MWEIAKKRANSISDSQFLLGLKSIAVDHYLHDAAIDVEGTAYHFLTKQIDTSVSEIGWHILLTQEQERDMQGVGIEEAREIQILWSKFVRQVKGVSTKHATSLSTSYVSCGRRIGLITQRCAGAQLSTLTTSKSGKHLSPRVCWNSSRGPGRISSTQQRLFISVAIKNLYEKMR